jgi:hypothetical protein
MAGRYLDVIVTDQGTARFKERRCVFDNYWTPEALIVPL